MYVYITFIYMNVWLRIDREWMTLNFDIGVVVLSFLSFFLNNYGGGLL